MARALAALALALAASSVAAEGAAPPDAAFDRARALIGEGRHRDAVDVVDAFLKGASDSDTGVVVEALKLKGSAHLRAGLHDQAIADFSSALAFAPDDIWLLWQRCWVGADQGYLLTARRDCRRARSSFERAAAAGQASPGDEYYVALAEANLLRALGRPGQAIAVLEPYADRLGEGALGWYLDGQIGQSLREAGDVTAAITFYDRAIGSAESASSADRAALHGGRAVALFDQGRASAAVRDLRAATSLAPGDEGYAYALCAAALLSDMTEEAVAACAELAALGQSNAVFLNAYGTALDRAGDLEGAVTYLGRALSYEPSNPQFHAQFSKALAQARAAGIAVDLEATLSRDAAAMHGLAGEKKN